MKLPSAIAITSLLWDSIFLWFLVAPCQCKECLMLTVRCRPSLQLSVTVCLCFSAAQAILSNFRFGGKQFPTLFLFHWNFFFFFFFLFYFFCCFKLFEFIWCTCTAQCTQSRQLRKWSHWFCTDAFLWLRWRKQETLSFIMPKTKLFLCVGVCVSVYVYMYVCMDALCVCCCVCMHACVLLCACVCVYTCYVCVYIYVVCIHVVCMCLYAVCVVMYVCVYVCMYPNLYSFTNAKNTQGPTP